MYPPNFLYLSDRIFFFVPFSTYANLSDSDIFCNFGYYKNHRIKAKNGTKTVYLSDRLKPSDIWCLCSSTMLNDPFWTFFRNQNSQKDHFTEWNLYRHCYYLMDRISFNRFLQANFPPSNKWLMIMLLTTNQKIAKNKLSDNK